MNWLPAGPEMFKQFIYNRAMGTTKRFRPEKGQQECRCYRIPKGTCVAPIIELFLRIKFIYSGRSSVISPECHWLGPAARKCNLNIFSQKQTVLPRQQAHILWSYISQMQHQLLFTQIGLGLSCAWKRIKNWVLRIYFRTCCYSWPSWHWSTHFLPLGFRSASWLWHGFN